MIRFNIKKILFYLLVIFICIIFFAPMILTIFNSFKTPAEIPKILTPPESFYLENFRIAWNRIGLSFRNSILIVLPATLLSTFIGTLGAYPLSQFKFKGDTIIYMILLTGLFIPHQIVLIPVFHMLTSIGLYDTIPGLWLVHMAYGLPLTTFFLRNYFATIPKSLLDSSLVDGCSFFEYYYKILLPLGKPGISVVLILQARSIWNDLLFGVTFSRSVNVRPVTVALATFVGATDVQYGALMAAAFIAIIPVIVIFFIFQENFVEGITSGSVKG